VAGSNRLLCATFLVAACALSSFAAVAQSLKPYAGPIFDAHLHYNADAQVPHPLADVLARFKRSGVRAILANSTPGDGTLALTTAAETRAAGIVVIPFVRLYSSREDYATWHLDESLVARAESAFASGIAAPPGAAGASAAPYRGLGEVHLFDSQDAMRPAVRRLVAFAESRQVPLLAHVDDAAIDLLMAQAPSAGSAMKIIWAHSGIGGVPTVRIDELMNRYPGLMGELSYRPGLLCNDGDASANQLPELCPEWRALLLKYPSRFVIGSDTWVNQRWQYYEALMQSYRGWLGTLPPQVARQIGWGNAAALFGVAPLERGAGAP
jgi:Amidohydrolase